MKIRTMINGIFVERTNQPLEVIERDMERDKWMSAAEALEYGIIDEVIG
jgi:ATP-dependent Clp protease, protease subunit